MTLVILAAGLGSRYGGLKQLDSISNNKESIIDFSLFDAIEAGFKKVVFVVRKDILEQIKALYTSKLKGKIKVEFVCQEIDAIPSKFKNNSRTKPWGTAHAVLMAKNVVSGNFCVINADDFYGKTAFIKISKFLKDTPITSNKYTMVGYKIENTLSKNGTVSRGECITDKNSFLVDINERTNIYKKNKKIVYNQDNKEIEIQKGTNISMNFWGFTPQIFNEIENQFYEFLKEHHQTEKIEFYLPLVVNNLIKKEKATVKVLETEASWMGITYKEDKEVVVSTIKSLKENKLYPENLWN